MLELVSGLERRWRAVRLLHRFLLAEFYALLATVVLFVPARLFGNSLALILALAVPSALVLLLIAADALLARPDPRLLLWDADSAHQGHHTLPAALGTLHSRVSETESTEETREIAAALRNRAESLAPRVRVENTYPWRIPLQGYLIPLAALALVLLTLFLNTAQEQPQPNPWLGYAQELRERSETIARAAEAEQDRSGAALARELSELAEMLESRPTEKETQERITRLLPRLQQGMRRLGATDLITDPETPRAGRMEGGDQSGSLRARRQEEGEGVPVLPDGLDGSGDAPRSDSAMKESLGEVSKELEAAEETLEQLQESLSGDDQSGRTPDERRDESDRAAGNSPGSGGGRDGESPGEEEAREPGGAGFDAGDEAVADLGEEESERLSGTVEQLLELPQSEGAAESFTELFAREAPGAPESNLTPEETLTAFERQVEEAVARSQIPGELRGMVRDYFLRIGEEQYE